MTFEIELHPHYKHTIERLEAVKRVTAKGVEYWMARDIHSLLGYQTWDGFTPVIMRATASLESNGLNASHHVRLTTKMMEVGKGAIREGEDYYLTRAACRLIAMNGDPSKPEIAAAQSYFIVQTHRMERQDALTEDEKRLKLREDVSSAFKTVSSVAKRAGVPNNKQALFHDARYQGLYGMSAREMKARKGLKQDDNPFDFAGPLELSANEFQMNMAADVIQKEAIKGDLPVIRRNKKIAEDVRSVMVRSGATTPENLPIAETIKQVEKRVKDQKKLAAKT